MHHKNYGLVQDYDDSCDDCYVCDGVGGDRDGWCHYCGGKGYLTTDEVNAVLLQDELDQREFDGEAVSVLVDSGLEAEILEERAALLQLDALTCSRCGGLLCDCSGIKAMRSGKEAA